MSIEIIQVKHFSQLKQFVRYPFDLYRNDNFWIPPLIRNEIATLSSDKNPAFSYCRARYWLAVEHQDGQRKIVGRIAAILNQQYMDRWRERVANIGWFDCINRKDVSTALFHAAEQWARENLCVGLSGPYGFTNFDPQGVLIEGFDQLPTIASVFNFPYYPELYESYGFVKDKDYLEFKGDIPETINEKAERLSRIVLKRTNTRLVESRSKKDIARYAAQIFEVINTAYRPLYSSVLLSEEQIKLYVKRFFGYVDHRFIKLIVDTDDRVVAFAITMPSLSHAFQKARGRLFPLGFLHIIRAMKKIKILDFYLIGILPEYQNKGLNAVFMTDLNKISIKLGLEGFETNSELESNQKVIAQWRYYQTTQHKRKRTYVKMF